MSETGSASRAGWRSMPRARPCVFVRRLLFPTSRPVDRTSFAGTCRGKGNREGYKRPNRRPSPGSSAGVRPIGRYGTAAGSAGPPTIGVDVNRLSWQRPLSHYLTSEVRRIISECASHACAFRAGSRASGRWAGKAWLCRWKAGAWLPHSTPGAGGNEARSFFDELLPRDTSVPRQKFDE